MDKLTERQIITHAMYGGKIISGKEIYSIGYEDEADYIKKIYPLITLLHITKYWKENPFSLLCHPLSSLTKEIEHNGEKFVPMKKLLREVWKDYPQECYNQDESWVLNEGYKALGELPHRKVQKLLEWHFWIHDQSAFEKGLVVDINTLKS